MNLQVKIMINEDINGILGNENIANVNHKEYIIGVLFLLFKFRIECLSTGKAEETFQKFRNLFKKANSAYLRKTSPIVDFEIEILSNVSCFFSKDLITAVTNLVYLLKYLRLYRKFKKR